MLSINVGYTLIYLSPHSAPHLPLSPHSYPYLSTPTPTRTPTQIYRALGCTMISYPLLFERSDFYLSLDMQLVLDDVKVSVNTPDI